MLSSIITQDPVIELDDMGKKKKMTSKKLEKWKPKQTELNKLYPNHLMFFSNKQKQQKGILDVEIENYIDAIRIDRVRRENERIKNRHNIEEMQKMRQMDYQKQSVKGEVPPPDFNKVFFKSDGTPVELAMDVVLGKRAKATRAGRFQKKGFYQSVDYN